MSEHTKGKVLLDQCTVYALNAEGYNQFWATVHGTHTSTQELTANARRLAACWNACDGIATEHLESECSAVMGWTRCSSKLLKATKQREQLLDALRSLLDSIPVPSSVCSERPAYEKARAAIAAATGGDAA